MGRNRENLRVNCLSPCILKYEGINYHALLENLSLGGASVKTGSEYPDNLYIGATVDMMLCSNPDLCPTKYQCKVIRLGPSDIGVNFHKQQTEDTIRTDPV
jgi:hypothetical protein